MRKRDSFKREPSSWFCKRSTQRSMGHQRWTILSRSRAQEILQCWLKTI